MDSLKMKNEISTVKPIGLYQSLLLFGLPTLFFFLITIGLIPWLNEVQNLHPAIGWFIGGLVTFMPLFIIALALARRDGYQLKSEMSTRFRLHKLTKQDWRYVAGSSLIIFTLTGIIMGLSQFLHTHFAFPVIDTNPSFMKFEPFEGNERYLLLGWMVMFFFNIYGEELLWRGYILPGQELHFKKYAWIINAVFWIVFHIPFGPGLIILMLPIMFILPWAVQRTGNTNVGILIHAILNGPMFILISLGIIK